MNAVAFALTITSFLPGASGVSGLIVDERNNPVPGARVFVEQGLASPLLEVSSNRNGSFAFENLSAGLTGVFASADGYAFSGTSLNLTIGQSVANVKIRLEKPGRVTGKVVARGGKSVEGARITRLVLLGNQRVGIPLTKLEPLGFELPVTDSRGRFTIGSLPEGVDIAVKVAHNDFAQEGISGIKVGSTKTVIELSSGILVSGKVVSQDSAILVSNATISVRNALPPHDTITTRSGPDGTFAMRLKPGPYLYQAAGPAYQSRGWQTLSVTGETPGQTASLQIVGMGKVTGKVIDAVSGEPIEGARLLLEYQGAPAHFARTGPTGEFAINAAGGDYLLNISSAPGFQTPKESDTTIRVESGKSIDLATFWLAPNPTYALQIYDAEGAPAARAVVRVLRPPQLGLHVADEKGYVELSFLDLPTDGAVVGLVEDLHKNEGALFSISKENAKKGVVQLLPLTSVTGKVVSERGPGLEGYIVEGRFALDLSSDIIVPWRTVSANDGSFTWNGVSPHVPQLCIAYHKDDPPTDTSAQGSASFIPESGKTTDLGKIIFANSQKGRSVLGEKLKWYNRPLLCGQLDPASSPEAASAVVTYCSAADAPAMIDAFAEAQKILALKDMPFAVVVDGLFECADAPIPVYEGKPPGAAGTYVLDRTGTVALETFGIPPLYLLSSIARASH